VAIPVTGWLTGRYGSKRIAAWSTIGFSLALMMPSLATNAVGLFAALTVFGAMAGANDVSINAQGVAVEAAVNSPVMSRLHAMFSAGGMVGAALGVVIAAHGVIPREHFFAASLLVVIAGRLTAPFLFESREGAAARSSRFEMRRVPNVVVTLAVIACCMFLSEGAMADWSGVYLKQDLHADHALAATAYAVFSCGMAIFRLLGDAITKRLGAVRTLRTGALIAAGGLTLALASKSVAAALPGFALTGAGFSTIVPLVFAAGGRVKSIRSEVGIAIVSGSGYAGFLLGPPFIGLLAEATSLRVALFAVVLLTLSAAGLAKAVEKTEGERWFEVSFQSRKICGR
jgi:MFS family permease